MRATVLITGAKAEQWQADAERIVGHAIVASGACYGDAVRSGLEAAMTQGFTHAIVFDTDRQTSVADLPQFVAAISESPEVIVSGVRPRSSLPQSVQMARGNCDFWTWLETGRWVTDSPLGFRAYPLAAIRDIAFLAKHQEFDVEILVKAIWAGTAVRTIVLTPTAGEKPQMMPLAEVGRFAWLTTRLMLQRLLLPAPLKKTINTKEFAASPVTWHVGRTLRDLALHRMRRPAAFGIACAMGAFFGVAPIWRYQLVIALLIASFTRLSKGAVIGAAIASSLMVKFLIYDRLLSADVSGHWTGRLGLATVAAVVGGLIAYGTARAFLKAQRYSS